MLDRQHVVARTELSFSLIFERLPEAVLQRADAGEVVRRAPDIVFGSWCGKKFRPEQVAARPGWSAMPAVRDGELTSRLSVRRSVVVEHFGGPDAGARNPARPRTEAPSTA